MERAELAAIARCEQISIAADLSQPLIRRATASLLACSENERIVDRRAIEQLLRAIGACPVPLTNAIAQLAQDRGHAFCLMLPLLWSRWDYLGRECAIAEEELPTTEFVGGIPLYTYDQHTSPGKRALRKFVRENRAVATALRRWVPEPNHAAAAGIAAFYADAAPVVSAFKWPTGDLFRIIGAMADMIDAGCPFEGVSPVMSCVTDELSHLNQLRRAALPS
jgi:hypothetical protein